MKKNALFLLAVLCSGIALFGQVSSTPIGTSYNIYSTLLDEQNQVSYNPEIDAVVFVHRHDDGSAGGSGGMAFNSSTNGGATWSSQFMTSPAFNAGSTAPVVGNRYPSITIYNPAGNTDPSNAYAVLTGPALHDPGTGIGWGYIFRHSAKLADGSELCEEYFTNNPSDPSDFHPYGLTTNANGEMWAMSTVFDAASAVDYENFNLLKGVFNPSTNCVDWSIAHTITPSYGPDNLSGFGWNMGFSPDGNTGYAVYLGTETSNIFFGVQPNVYKTSDAGATWSRLPDFDFRTLTAFNILTPTSTGEKIPLFSSIDLVVDENGALHLFSEVNPRSSSNADSATFIFTTQTVLYAMSTTDGTDWNARAIAETGLTDGSLGGVSIGPRTQLSRTQDGSKVFYSWALSDEAIPSGTNDAPDLWVRGLDVATGSLTDATNFTGGTSLDGDIFYPTMAPVVMETGTKDYEMAIVYSTPGVDDLAPPTYKFIKGVGFDESDFPCSTAPVLSPAMVSATSLDLNWTPVPGSFGCKVRWGRLPGTFDRKTIFPGPGISSASIPVSTIFPGNYQAKIRCGCAAPDTITAPVSNTVYFSIPSPRMASMTIQPNPVKATNIALQIESSAEETGLVRLMDIAGRVLSAQQVSVSDGINTVYINIESDLPNGTYLLHYSDSQISESQRIVLAR